MTRIVSVSSGRADVGILAPIWDAIVRRGDAELHIFLTGMHCAPDAPQVSVIPNAATVHRGGADLGGRGDETATAAMAAIARDAGRLFADISPDMVLLAGDRLDMIPAALASLPLNLRLAHLHGGEITEGAIDDRVRNAISKLAHLHCVSSEAAKSRLMDMGVAGNSIVVTGAPGLDTLKSSPQLDVRNFAAKIDFDGIADDLSTLRLVTVHPETNATDPLAPVDAVLGALDARPAPTLITAPNSDPGGAEARRRIAAFAAERPWVRFVDTLGHQLYANALRHAAVMVGNSSSGIIEAGLFGLPVIDVGDRQKGRERGPNVQACRNKAEEIVQRLDSLEVGARHAPWHFYGNGHAGQLVADALVPNPIRRHAAPNPMGDPDGRSAHA